MTPLAAYVLIHTVQRVIAFLRPPAMVSVSLSKGFGDYQGRDHSSGLRDILVERRGEPGLSEARRDTGTRKAQPLCGNQFTNGIGTPMDS